MSDRFVSAECIDQVYVRDFSRSATHLHGTASTPKEQADFCMRMIRRPADNAERFERVWTTHVYAARDAHEMSPRRSGGPGI